MSRMETRLTKLEEDMAEIKGMLKSFFTKMDNRDDEGEQPAGKGANKSALGPHDDSLFNSRWWGGEGGSGADGYRRSR